MMLARIDISAGDKGPRRSSAGKERLCILTREVRPAGDMIRFVVDPDGAVVADLKGRLPGRGVWVTATRQALTEAVKRNVFRRGFRRDVTVAADFPARIEARLERHVLDALSIAHKAGRLVLGFAKVEVAIGSGPAVAIIHAVEAGSDGVRKIARARAARRGQETGEIAEIRAFTSAQLDLALGRSNVVHAALLAGPASDRFLARWHILERFRAGDPGGGATALVSRTKME
jgi:uncharacterized protein